MKTLSSKFHGVFFDYLTKTLYQNEQNYGKFKFRICKEHIMSSFIVAYLRKNHFLVNKIDEKIGAFKSSGLLTYWIDKYTARRFKMLKNTSATPSQLTLINLQGAFEILIYGLMISLVSLIIEYVAFKTNIGSHVDRFLGRKRGDNK